MSTANGQLSANPAELGFISSLERQDVPLNAMTGPSVDWLAVRGKLRRRGGSKNIAVGLLESAQNQLSRRMQAVKLPSISSGYEVPVILFAKESAKRATIGFQDTNIGPTSWRTVGMEFSGTTYPDAAVPKHRVLPLLYENQYGGVTMHRLNTITDRESWLAGSRDFLQVRGRLHFPGYNSVPCYWDGRFDDGTVTDAYYVAPTGMIPPLQLPACNTGNSTSTTLSAWLGTDSFFYSVLFENEEGELSLYAIPRPPNSAWPNFPGFGYKVVDASNPTHYYDSLVYSNIPDGPPGTRWKWLLRTTKVDSTKVAVPSLDTLSQLARIPQGIHTYVDADGNDNSLNTDPRIFEMTDKSGRLVFPARSRTIGRTDGRITIGCERRHPAALFIAPWGAGTINAPIDDASLYGATSYFAANVRGQLYLRAVIGGVATDTVFDMRGLTLRQLVDQINSNADNSTTLTILIGTNCQVFAGGTGIFRSSAFTGVEVGDFASGTGVQAGSKIVSFLTVAGPLYVAVMDRVATIDSPTIGAGGETVTFTRPAVGGTGNYAAAVVPGADGDEPCTSLLYTYVQVTATYSLHGTTATISGGDTAYITPGMHVVDTDWPSDTIVTGISGSVITLSKANTAVVNSGSVSMKLGYDTGDTTLGLLPGFSRMFGNAFPTIMYWGQSYLAQFDDRPQDSTFSVNSPGYPSDAVQTWMARNSRGAPDSFGPLVKAVDLGPVELRFHVHGRMRLWNTRTGLTHADEDYNNTVDSWLCGSVCPYATFAGNGWAVALREDGLYVVDASHNEAVISLNLYRRSNPAGTRGELEYAIEACVAAAAAGTDAYKLSAQVHGSVILVRYFASASSDHFDRQIPYDFSESVGRLGITEVIRGRDANGNPIPYPWGAPQGLAVACSAQVHDGNGEHLYAASDVNAGGDPDGRMDELNTGTRDIAPDATSVPVLPVAYTGLYLPRDLAKVQPKTVRAVSTKPGPGMGVALTREPWKNPEDAKWDMVDLDTSGPDAFGRSVKLLEPADAEKRIAIGARITDDGTGAGAELSKLLIDAVEWPSAEK